MVDLYMDPQGETVFTKTNQSENRSTDQPTKSDSAPENNTVATLKRRVTELETMLTESLKQVRK